MSTGISYDAIGRSSLIVNPCGHQHLYIGSPLTMGQFSSLGTRHLLHFLSFVT